MTPTLVTTDKIKNERIRTIMQCRANLSKNLSADSILEDIEGTRRTLYEWAQHLGKTLNDMYYEYVMTCDYILIK